MHASGWKMEAVHYSETLVAIFSAALAVDRKKLIFRAFRCEMQETDLLHML
jgi:hypothetical protein